MGKRDHEHFQTTSTAAKSSFPQESTENRVDRRAENGNPRSLRLVRHRRNWQDRCERIKGSHAGLGFLAQKRGHQKSTSRPRSKRRKLHNRFRRLSKNNRGENGRTRSKRRNGKSFSTVRRRQHRKNKFQESKTSHPRTRRKHKRRRTTRDDQRGRPRRRRTSQFARVSEDNEKIKYVLKKKFVRKCVFVKKKKLYLLVKKLPNDRASCSFFFIFSYNQKNKFS